MKLPPRFSFSISQMHTHTHISFSNFTSYMVFRIFSHTHTLLLSVNANLLRNDKTTTPMLVGQFLTAICIGASSPFV